MLERITQLLAGIGAPGSFATRTTSAADDLRLDVKGVGPVPLPVSSAAARKLCAVAQPARYGLREQTLLDERVRDGWEIGKSRIKIDSRRWQRTLVPQLEKIGRDLGLPDGCTLRAELYNLLVYGPGQFFAPHQDSEKADGMIGTLVVTLPSVFKGGALAIEHHDEKVSYRGSADRLTFVAFYADCHHEVRPVTDGYRVVLTYNLFVDGAAAAIRSPSGKPHEALVELVGGHFTTPRPARGPLRPSEGPPDRLVYLLDHQYTQAGLGWQRLKNGDAVRVAALRDVAARLDCELVLALADVHESWSCEDDSYGGGFGRWRRDEYDDDDDEPEDDGDGDYTLVELFDSSIELRHALDSSGRRVTSISAAVEDDEICYTKASADLEPFASEHEGYTGNAGNTVDRWYHRAAVVLWPRARTFVVRAKASPKWGIREIAKLLVVRKLDEARARATQLRPFWNRVARDEPGQDFVEQVVRVAADLDAPELAATLLESFSLQHLTPRVAPRCAALLDRYGLPWCVALFKRWATHEGYREREPWLAALPELCGSLCADGSADQLELTRQLVRSQWAWVKREVKYQRDHLPSIHAVGRLLALNAPILGLLESNAIAPSHDVHQEIIELVTSERDFPLRSAIALLRAAGARRSAPTLGLSPLYQHCLQAVTAVVTAPPRAKNDWSISTLIRCTCELCKKLTRFLIASSEQGLEWPLAKDRRAHVHQIIERDELPMTHQTRHVGSPHVLVLAKTRALFTREASERKARTADLAWLNRSRASFVDAPAISRAGRPARRAGAPGR